MCCKALSVARIVSTEYMSEFLIWPDTLKRKGRRWVERQPFALTSGKYRKIFENKHLAKAAEEEEKHGQKRKGEEAKQDKNENVSQGKQLKETLIEGNDKVEYNTVCNICKRRIKCGRELCCKDCCNFYNELCIPKYHKKQISVLEYDHSPLAQLLQRRQQCR
jgi:hypothetical protein